MKTMNRIMKRFLTIPLCGVLISAVLFAAAPLVMAAADDPAPQPGILPRIPNDPDFYLQWGLDKIEAPYAWSFHTGSYDTTVAVVDRGVDYTHEDLYLNIWINEGEIPPGVRVRLEDVDDDGLITFYDLNDPINQGDGKIVDNNANGYIDGGDLLALWEDGADNDGNGYVDDLIGWDFNDNDNDPFDANFHGTGAAGILGAVGDNGPGRFTHGIAGVNWTVRMMPVRLPLKHASEWQSAPDIDEFINFPATAGRALKYAVDNGARISNHSYGFWIVELDVPDWLALLSPLGWLGAEAASAYAEKLAQMKVDSFKDAVAYAQSQGHIVVASAGNGEAVEGNPLATDKIADNTDELPFYPASFAFENIISVAATDERDDRLFRSNFGPASVDLGAPGGTSTDGGIYTTTTSGNGYDSEFDGTSAAAPHVAGVASLVWDMNPDWSYQQVIEQILGTVDPVPSLEGKTVTGGRLNALGAVAPGGWVTDVAIAVSYGDSVSNDGLCQPRPVKLDKVTLTFNEAVNPATFGLEDIVEFVAPASDDFKVVVTGIEAVPGSNNRRFDINFALISRFPGLPVSGAGAYSLAIGPEIADQDGDLLDLDRDGIDGETYEDRYQVGFTISDGSADSLICNRDLLYDAVPVFELEARDLFDIYVPPLDYLGSVKVIIDIQFPVNVHVPAPEFDGTFLR